MTENKIKNKGPQRSPEFIVLFQFTFILFNPKTVLRKHRLTCWRCSHRQTRRRSPHHRSRRSRHLCTGNTFHWDTGDQKNNFTLSRFFKNFTWALRPLQPQSPSCPALHLVFLIFSTIERKTASSPYWQLFSVQPQSPLLQQTF